MSLQESISRIKELQHEIRQWFISNIKYQKESVCKIHIVTLFCSTLEYVDGFFTLLESEYAQGCLFILVRSMFEASVDICCLFNDKHAEKYWEWLFAKRHLKEQHDSLKNAPENLGALFNKNDIEKSINGNFDEKLKELKQELDENRKSPYNSIPKRIEVAGLDSSFCGIYTDLCSDVHNGSKALMQRYVTFEENSPGLIKNINCFSIYSEETLSLYVEIVAILLFTAWNAFQGKIKCADEEVTQNIKKIYSGYREALKLSAQ